MKNIGDYFSVALYLFLTISVLNSEMPHKYFAAFICLIGAVESYVKTIDTDYCRRLSRRLRHTGLALALFLLIKLWFSI